MQAFFRSLKATRSGVVVSFDEATPGGGRRRWSGCCSAWNALAGPQREVSPRRRLERPSRADRAAMSSEQCLAVVMRYWRAVAASGARK
jgi:hypothetical protein